MMKQKHHDSLKQRIASGFKVALPLLGLIAACGGNAPKLAECTPPKETGGYLFEGPEPVAAYKGRLLLYDNNKKNCKDELWTSGPDGKGRKLVLSDHFTVQHVPETGRYLPLGPADVTKSEGGICMVTDKTEPAKVLDLDTGKATPVTENGSVPPRYFIGGNEFIFQHYSNDNGAKELDIRKHDMDTGDEAVFIPDAYLPQSLPLRNSTLVYISQADGLAHLADTGTGSDSAIDGAYVGIATCSLGTMNFSDLEWGFMFYSIAFVGDSYIAIKPNSLNWCTDGTEVNDIKVFDIGGALKVTIPADQYEFVLGQGSDYHFVVYDRQLVYVKQPNMDIASVDIESGEETIIGNATEVVDSNCKKADTFNTVRIFLDGSTLYVADIRAYPVGDGGNYENDGNSHLIGIRTFDLGTKK
jgi:hypothetical protein